MTYALVRPRYLSLDAFAAAAGLHPELVARLAALGLLEPSVDARGIRWFRAADLAVAARIHRLHTGLPLNYAAIGVVLDLLDRIDELEATLRRRSWISTD
ncbi:chaperone modulator CbpM [Dactylosporangium sp. NPDC000244]|uniref:chaperone modulator CbpM n=1 Tax=Dactylosporangium sp. NPDC000244 TaxID=3154365 RepID=UPI00331E6DEE